VHPSVPNSPIYGLGGTGGGGNGARSGTDSVDGTVNTGGGGGGCSEGFSPRRGAAGGSGIVILRAPKAAANKLSVSPGTNTKTTTPTGDVICTFTVSGTLTVS
jgi:hypothetical protein